MPVEILYPTTRLDRAEPLNSVSGPAAPARPTVRLWPFALQETTPGDRQAASPLLRGPAVVDHVYLNWQDDNSTPRPTITVFYGPTVPPSGNAVITNIADLGTQMFADGVLSQEVVGTYQTPLQHLSKVAGGVDTGKMVFPVRFPIYLDTFQLLVRYGTQTGGSQILTGYVRVLEQVPLELISNFL